MIGPLESFQLLRSIIPMLMNKYSNAIAAITHANPSDKFVAIAVEMLSDTGENCFIVNNLALLHDLVPSKDTVKVTGGSNVRVDYERTLCLCLFSTNKKTKMLI